MKPTPIVIVAALSAVVLFSGCASTDEPAGQRLTLKERWGLMAQRQDTRAADFVSTDDRFDEPVIRPTSTMR